MVENRVSRDETNRDKSTRKKAWERPETLPRFDPGPGWVPRWIRLSTLGQLDATNISSKLREGWEPVLASDYPEILSDPVVDQRFKDNVIVGGLIACKAPQEMVEERNAYYNKQAHGQMQSVDNNLMRENDPRMPLFNDRKSTVTFGKG
jgi:hypothetical protein